MKTYKEKKPNFSVKNFKLSINPTANPKKKAKRKISEKSRRMNRV